MQNLHFQEDISNFIEEESKKRKIIVIILSIFLLLLILSYFLLSYPLYSIIASYYESKTLN